MIATFWALIALIFYCYFLYPLLVALFSKFFLRKVQKGNDTPTLTFILSVYNEEDVIENKLKNLLSLDYPPEKMQILVGSDGSTDKTNAIVRNLNHPRVRLIENSERKGKPAVLNQLVSSISSELIVFTDARQEFAPDAIRQLVGNFRDEKIGCVSGELIFTEEKGVTAQGVNLYWNYEKFIRKAESRIHSMLGATGAIYAIRRRLFVGVPANTVLDDMFIPFQVILKGYRAILDETAKAYDAAATTATEEYRRKVRTLCGNYQIFSMLPQMFNPFVSPVALQLFSHKFLRVMVPFFLIIILGINFVLADINGTYRNLLILQIIFYVMAAFGALSRHRKYGILKILSKVCYVPYIFCLLNFSAIAAFARFVTAKQEVTWTKARER